MTDGPVIPTRTFGRTGLKMPVFSCGGMRYQQSWQDVPLREVERSNQRNLEAIIERAVELGIRHIETARGYGSSERQLGRILPRFDRNRLIVQTKVGPRADPKEFVKSIRLSLKRLRLDYVDLLAIHGINNRETFDWAMRPGGCLEAARALQRAGAFRYLGFSTHGSPDLIAETARTGEFDYVNLHWYYFYQQTWIAVKAAMRQNMGVFIISPSDKGGKLYEPSDKLIRLCAPLSPMAFNDAFCLLRPEVHTLSIGASRPGDFEEHRRALPLLADPALVRRIDRRIRAEMESVLGADWMASWDRDLPSWEDLPGEINAFEILRLRNLAVALDMVEYGKMRYNLLGNGGHWFPGRSASRVRSEPLRRALAGHPFCDRIPDLLRDAHRRLGGATVKRLSEGD
jgi:uncharacterized protein